MPEGRWGTQVGVLSEMVPLVKTREYKVSHQMKEDEPPLSEHISRLSPFQGEK